MKEAAEVTMESIYERLQRSKELFGQIAPAGQTSNQALVRDFKVRFGDTNLAKSEELLTTTDLMRLKLKTERLRNGVFMVGHPFNQDPLYREWLRDGILTQPQADRLFFIRDGGVIVKAELDPSDNGVGLKIAMTVRERDRMIDLGLDFSEGYWLNIEYGDRMDDSYAEYQTYEALSSMTADEYQIFSHYMNTGRRIIDEKS